RYGMRPQGHPANRQVLSEYFHFIALPDALYSTDIYHRHIHANISHSGRQPASHKHAPHSITQHPPVPVCIPDTYSSNYFVARYPISSISHHLAFLYVLNLRNGSSESAHRHQLRCHIRVAV